MAVEKTGGVSLFFSFGQMFGVWLAIRYRNQRNPAGPDPRAFGSDQKQKTCLTLGVNILKFLESYFAVTLKLQSNFGEMKIFGK